MSVLPALHPQSKSGLRFWIHSFLSFLGREDKSREIDRERLPRHRPDPPEPSPPYYNNNKPSNFRVINPSCIYIFDGGILGRLGAINKIIISRVEKSNREWN